MDSVDRQTPRRRARSRPRAAAARCGGSVVSDRHDRVRLRLPRRPDGAGRAARRHQPAYGRPAAVGGARRHRPAEPVESGTSRRQRVGGRRRDGGPARRCAPTGYLALRGMKPPAPYLHHGRCSEPATRANTIGHDDRRPAAAAARPGPRPSSERGVECPGDLPAASDPDLVARARAAKDALGDRVFVLGHHYQRDEVIEFADVTGDSFKLARDAAAPARGGVHRLLRRALHGRVGRHPHRRRSRR